MHNLVCGTNGRFAEFHVETPWKLTLINLAKCLLPLATRRSITQLHRDKAEQDKAKACVILRYARRCLTTDLSDSYNRKKDHSEAQRDGHFALLATILLIVSLTVPLGTAIKIQASACVSLYVLVSGRQDLVPPSRPRFALSRMLNDNERSIPAGAP